MTDVTDPEYWRGRVAEAVARGELHRAIYEGSSDSFSEHEASHKTLVGRSGIRPDDSVLDVGCGYGRLLNYLGVSRPGEYVGIDISPDLVAVARRIHTDRTFECVRDTVQCLKDLPDRSFDVVAALWLKAALLRNGQGELWGLILRQMERVAERVVVID